MDKRIEHLKRVLSFHDDLYYNEDNPEITDKEYDALKEEYLELIGQKEYDYVPGNATLNNKVNHTYPIRSLAKVNTREDLEKEVRRLWPVILEPKFDGLTLVIYPCETEELMQLIDIESIVTRGNGTIGEDVTANAINIKGLGGFGVTIQKPIRGEAIIPLSVFREINAERIKNGEEPFKNPRNAAAGMLRNKDASKVKGVEFYAYNILGLDTLGMIDATETVQINILLDWQWQTTPHWTFPTPEETVDFIMNFDRDSLDYEIDGMVIKSDKEDSLNLFGETGHHPKNAVAYKFPAQGVWTKLNKVTWQVGRTGKVTPVGHFDPVEILGSTVSKATLHNPGIISALNLRLNEQVFVIKANDVIPAIIESKHSMTRDTFPIITPKTCPNCGSILTAINDQLFCESTECSSKQVDRLVHLAKRDALNIEGLSDETSRKLFEQEIISDPFDIFNLTVDDLMNIEGYGKRSAEKLYKNIQAARSTEFKRFIYAVGLPNIGRSVSEDIANKFGTWEAFREDGSNDFVQTRTIEGIGNAIINSFKNYGYLLGELLEYVKPIPTVVKTTTVPDEVLTFVVTGTFDISRNEIQDMIKKAGHKASGSVSKKTDYVVVGENAGSKETKAIELGIKIIKSLDELEEILK